MFTSFCCENVFALRSIKMGGFFRMATQNFFLMSVFPTFFLLVQAANIEAEGSGIPYSEYQLIKQEVSGLGRGKYSGTHDSYNLFTCLSAACLAVLR